MDEQTNRTTSADCADEIMDSLACLIYGKHTDGRYYACNAAFARYVGKDKADIIGKTAYEIFRPEEAVFLDRMDQELLATRQEQVFEATFAAADGGGRQVLLQKTPCRNQDGEITGIVGVLVDISERKQAEEAREQERIQLSRLVTEKTQELQLVNVRLEEEMKLSRTRMRELEQLEEKFSKAFQHCQDVIGIIRLRDQTYIEVNDSFFTIFGYAREEVIGHCSTEFKLWEDLEVRQAFYNMRALDEKNEGIDAVWLTKTGERRIGSHSNSLIELAGEPHVLFVWHDVTARKRAEDELQRSNEELEKKVLERTRELMQMISELTQTQKQLVLQEKMAGIGQLAAGVAHELNNPLGFVSSNVSMLDSYQKELRELHGGYCGNGPTMLEEKKKRLRYIIEDVPELIRETRDGILRMTEIVKALRTFSRMDQSARKEPYNLNEGIKTTLVIARNELKYVADIVTELTDIPVIMAQGGQINQVLLNILVNAAHAIKDSGIERGEIRIATQCDGAVVRCAITNNGPPIPEEIRGRIFEPFFTTKPVGQGTGIGLSLSYDIVVNHHGGRLYFSSAADTGTTFWIELPLAGGEEQISFIQELIR